MMKQTDNSHTPQVSVAVIDNYDSFTYNLVHLVRSLGAQVTVFRNDLFDLPDLADYDKLLLSPGPGIPSEAGLLLDVIRTYAATKPILGVCLGHQAIGEAFGGKVVHAPEIVHGKSDRVYILKDNPLLAGMENGFQAARYHSLIVEPESLPACLEVIAETKKHEIMALQHKEYKVYGVQFHPESIMTPEGRTILKNFLSL